MIAVVQSDKRCASGSVVVVVDAGTVVVVAGAIVVVGMVVVGVVVTHASSAGVDVTNPKSKMGAIAMTDKLCVDDRTTRTSAMPAMTANKAKSAAMTRPVLPPVEGNLQTVDENICENYQIVHYLHKFLCIS